MHVYLNSIVGLDDAMVALTMSRRTWTREKEEGIRQLVFNRTLHDGSLAGDLKPDDPIFSRIDKVKKYGQHHITLLKFIDLSVTVEGLHRAGQDDWDSHAKRFDNRIIRSSTRLATFDHEMSDWYQGKIIPTDEALTYLGLETPETLEKDGVTYVRTVNGYIREDMKDDKDVKRGLYMLSIPSNFIFKINLAEWAHVYKMRNASTQANPEVKECCEQLTDLIQQAIPQFDREFFMNIEN